MAAEIKPEPGKQQRRIGSEDENGTAELNLALAEGEKSCSDSVASENEAPDGYLRDCGIHVKPAFE